MRPFAQDGKPIAVRVREASAPVEPAATARALRQLARLFTRRHMATNSRVSDTSGLPEMGTASPQKRLDSSRHTSVHVPDD